VNRSSGAPSAGIVGAAAFVACLVGVLLWLAMVLAPYRVATGVLTSASSLERAERRLSAGKVREARFETLRGVAAAERARRGLDLGGPLLDLVSFVPRAGAALEEVPHVVRAAELSARAARGALTVADEALRGGLVRKDPDDPEGSIVDLNRLRHIGDVVSDVRTTIAAARRELEAIDLKVLPRRAAPRIREGIEKAEAADARLADAEAGFAVLPAIMGAEGPRTYLIGFQNPSEQRGTGGSILQFSTLEMDGGRLTLGEERTDKDAAMTVYEIDQNRRQYDIPLPDDAFYVRSIPDAQRFGNSNWSPDWPTSAQLMIAYAEAAEAANPGRIEVPEFDGFIVVDPVAVEKMMAGIGPFRAAGHRVTAGNIRHLTLYRAYGLYPVVKIRRAVLRKVVQGFVRKAINPPQPSELAAGMGEALAQKHIQIWMEEAAEQAYVERMEWDGAIKSARNSDYFYLVEQNVGGNKLDYFSRHTTSLDISFDGSDSVVSAEAAVENRVFSPQPRWIMGDSGPFHKPMLNVYVPGDAVVTHAETTAPRDDTPPPAVWPAEGVPAENHEAGKKVWSATLVVPPHEEGALRLEYRVPGVVRTTGDRSSYRLVVQHQPRVDPEQLVVRIRLPDGARGVRAKGWERRGEMLVYDEPLTTDIALEVSWRS
jgi:hypothetical protein